MSTVYYDSIVFLDLDSFTQEAKARIHTNVMNNNDSDTKTNSHGLYVGNGYNASCANNPIKPPSIPLYAKITGRGKRLGNEYK